MNYAQQAKMYLASDAAIVTISMSSTPTPTTSNTQANPTPHTASMPLGFITCPAGCVPISSASTTISIMPTSSTPSSGVASPAAAGCPVSGGSCQSGAMACDGYYYGQCANGVWVVRKCADGLACFSENGAVYCDWASNGVITSCSGSSSSTVKRETGEFGDAFVGGDSSSVMTGSTSMTTSGGTSSMAGATADIYEVATGASIGADDLTTEGTQYTDVTTTTVPATIVADDSIQVTPVPDLFNYSVHSVSALSTSNSTTSLSTSLSTHSGVIYNSTDDTSSNSTISNLSSPGPTPSTTVSLSIQPLNNTNFVAILQASTPNNTPILTDWSFSFKSEYRILETDRGNLTLSGVDLTTYTITSIPIQEPAVNMAVVVRLWGVYRYATSAGMIGSSGVENANSGSSGNGSFALFKRAFSWLN